MSISETVKTKFLEWPSLAFGIPGLLSGIAFLANLIDALQDGKIDLNEFHTLASSASGLETIVLAIIWVVFKKSSR